MVIVSTLMGGWAEVSIEAGDQLISLLFCLFAILVARAEVARKEVMGTCAKLWDLRDMFCGCGDDSGRIQMTFGSRCSRRAHALRSPPDHLMQ